MSKMFKSITGVLFVIAFIFGFSTNALAIPVFQAYINGATGTTMGSDEDTWFSSANPFTLYVVGAYKNNVSSLTNVTLVVSVPQGEKGTLSLSADQGDASDSPILFTTGADADLLNNPAGNDGFKTQGVFPYNFSNHYPFKDSVSDFLLFALGSFTNTESNLNNYSTEDGISGTNTSGEEKRYSVNYSGFSALHFDVFGWTGSAWDINPGSHDSTAFQDGGTPPQDVVPEPSTMLLLNGGLVALWAFRKRA